MRYSIDQEKRAAAWRVTEAQLPDLPAEPSLLPLLRRKLFLQLGAPLLPPQHLQDF